MFDNKGIIQIPIWNGVCKSFAEPRLASFQLISNPIKGVFEQKNKNVINYKNNYIHMTPLSGSKYINHIHSKKRKLLSKISKKFENILEIGGGDISLTKFFDYNNFTVVDPCINLKKLPNIKKVFFYKSTFENFNPKNKFNLIILFSVLEHVNHLGKFSKNLNKVLDTNGKLLVVLPIVDNQFKIGDINAILHEHTYYFTKIGFQNYCLKYNFKIIYSKIENDCGYFILKKNYLKNKTFLKSNISKKDIIRLMNNKIQSNINIILKHKKINFVGATNGLNILLYILRSHFNNNNTTITIFDNDKLKKGKYISSIQSKIKHRQIYNKNLKYFISAMSFYKEIKYKLKNNTILN